MAGHVIARDGEKLGAGAGFHLVSGDVAFEGGTVDLLDRIGVARLVANRNAVLIGRFVTFPLNVGFPLCQPDTRHQAHKA